MMKIIDILKIKNKGFSFEFFPPKTERAKELFLLTVNIIKNFLGCFKNYPIHCFVMSISKSKCDRKLSKLIMKLLLLLNFVFISTLSYPMMDPTKSFGHFC